MQKQTRKNKDEKAIASAEDSVRETHSISIKPFMFYFDLLDQKLTQRGGNSKPSIQLLLKCLVLIVI